MNRFFPIVITIFAGLILFFPFDSHAAELESRYATITYSDDGDLRDFNHDLYMGRLKSRIKGSTDTIEEEVVAKINFIVEKVMSTLDMFPPGLRFSIEILLIHQLKKLDLFFHLIITGSPKLFMIF